MPKDDLQIADLRNVLLTSARLDSLERLVLMLGIKIGIAESDMLSTIAQAKADEIERLRLNIGDTMPEGAERLLPPPPFTGIREDNA